MRTRVMLLVLILVVLMLNITGALAQDETPATVGPFAQTAAAAFEMGAATPRPAEEATPEATAEATAESIVEPTEPADEATEAAAVEPSGTATETPEAEEQADGSAVRGLPLGVLLIGAVAVLLIGTVVLVRENPRPLDLDDEE